MPGFNQQQLSYQALNANRTLVMIGAQTLAFAQTVSHTFDLGAEGLYGVGTAKPQEIQQLKVAPSITVNQFSLTARGIQLIQQTGLPLASLIANNQFNVSIIDGITGNALFIYVGCVAQNFSQSVPMNQVISEDIAFLAMDVWDGTGQSILNGPNALSITANFGQVVTTGLGVAALG